MPQVSLIINCDTREPNDKFKGENLGGVVNEDFLVAGILNKQKFLEGFDFETIVYVDKHAEIPDDILMKLQTISDILVIRKHTDETSFNDWNYYRALSLATGDIVIHIDQDTACFRCNKSYVEELIGYLNDYKFVSYPSHWTPNAVVDTSFGSRTWASTRFFICKRESLKLNELYTYIKEPELIYEKYGDSPRRCNWTEHFLTLMNEDSCFYPPVELHKGAVFSWGSYTKGTLQVLNQMEYELVKQWILHNGGIVYPVDVYA